MEFFNSISDICDTCSNWRHHIYIKKEHKSCLCILEKYKAICCVDGYVNTLKAYPKMNIIPEWLYITKVLYTSYAKPLILSEFEENLSDRCSHLLKHARK